MLLGFFIMPPVVRHVLAGGCFVLLGASFAFAGLTWR